MDWSLIKKKNKEIKWLKYEINHLLELLVNCVKLDKYNNRDRTLLNMNVEMISVSVKKKTIKQIVKMKETCSSVGIRLTFAFNVSNRFSSSVRMNDVFSTSLFFLSFEIVVFGDA